MSDGEADGGVDRIDGVGLNGCTGQAGGTEDEGGEGEELDGCFHGMSRIRRMSVGMDLTVPNKTARF
jgi:hypothetical protein